MNDTQARVSSYQGIRSKVAKFNYFDEWDEETITKLCNVSRIKTFASDQVILGGKCDLKSYVYFVVEGSCRLVECLNLPKQVQSGVRTRTCFVNVGIYIFIQSLYWFYRKWLQVCTLNRLSCFNIGENLENRQIVAISDTECLLIPFYWLLERNDANIWVRIKQFLTWKMPKTSVIIEQLLKEEKWSRRKHKLIKAKAKRKVDTIGFHQVPYSLKVQY
ncbi:uncharacterized protein LOC135137340 [Zophobas morio]|uniref:uncharacterized protein LOC135137340 n=1 Tax=Zophobas morio TaxID=2755281 RepID=UPI003083AFE1